MNTFDDAIQAQKDVGFSEQADYLSILWFVAAAEHVPTHVLEKVLEEEFIMAGGYYRSVIAKGKAEGLLEGEAKSLAATILRTLERRLGSVAENLRKSVLAETNLTTLRAWHELAIDAIDAETAQHLVDTIHQSQAA